MKPRTTTTPFARSSWAAAPTDRETNGIDAFRARLRRVKEASNIHEPLTDAPALFTDADIYNAVRTAECWLKIPIPEAAAAIRDKFHAHLVNTGTWERGGCSTEGSDWRVFMRRVADDMSRVVLMRDYPSQQFYAAEDVEALPVCD